jgi:hypothetical protein
MGEGRLSPCNFVPKRCNNVPLRAEKSGILFQKGSQMEGNYLIVRLLCVPLVVNLKFDREKKKD